MDGLIDRINQKVGREANDFDLIYRSGHSTQINFENNKFKNIETSVDEGLGLRVIKDNKIGFSSTTNIRNEKELIDNAIRNCETW